jgi:glycosyltransferase involved in cell wall biosynthesis
MRLARLASVKIAQISPLVEAVPPPKYGGTERIVSYLTEQLVEDGHDVTLFASGDSTTTARLIPICPRALRLDGPGDALPDYLPYHMVQLARVLDAADEFDVLHFHTDLVHFPVADQLSAPVVTTLHGRLDRPDTRACLQAFGALPFVSISHDQRTPIRVLNWSGTVYHGLPRDLYSFRARPSDYLAFVGRLSQEKRVDRAIEIAARAGARLVIAAKVDPRDRAYFEQAVAPLLDQPHVEFLGEIGDAEKQEVMGNAAGLLFPIDWPEPFGMVVIEAFACGTPVIAFEHGAMSELIDHGSTGFLATTIEEGVRAVEDLGTINRRRCRDEFERRFSAERMAADYVAIYESLIQERTDDAAAYRERWPHAGEPAQRSA